MVSLNTIDYSGLNKSLQTKRPIESIKQNIAEAIGEVFLSGVTRNSEKEKRLNTLSDQIEKGSENMKTRLILTIDYLKTNKLLETDSIKSLSANKIKEIAGAENSNKFLQENDKKIQNIIDYLVNTGRKKGQELTNQQKEELKQSVIDGLDAHYGNLAEKDDKNDDLKARNDELMARNDELEAELNASEKSNEVVERAILSRRSNLNLVRVGKSIENINLNKKGLDPATKARKVLWQANHNTIFGSGVRFDRVNKLPSKFKIKEEYYNVSEKLVKQMDNAKPKEQIAIRYIMRQVNKAYEEYVNAISVDEETRRKYMDTINRKMAA